MAKIAYIDHSFHKKTKSNLFLVDLLEKYHHCVDFFWSEDWQGGPSVHFNEVLDYDIVLMFQMRCASDIEYYSLKHQNVIYVPMLDSLALSQGPIQNSAGYWNIFQGSKVLSFSSAMHSIVTSLGIYSLFVKYYPEPYREKADFSGGLHGFFWLRSENLIPWHTISKLLDTCSLSSLHIHAAPDPLTPPVILPTEEELEKYNITITKWFDKQEDYLKIMEKKNVFFAPRLDEGIGQSFLEAMARGQCVVAPNHGTMNEYILNGVNGLLYSEISPEILDFSEAAQYGEIAYQSVQEGYIAWQKIENKILDFILTPSSILYGEKYQFLSNERRTRRLENALLESNFTKIEDIIGKTFLIYILKFYFYRFWGFLWPSKRLKAKFEKYKRRFESAKYCRSLLLRDY